MNTFFTSDTHFSHVNIIKYSKRPYDSVLQMNEDMILKWNRKVTLQDTVYFLGDFCFADIEKGQSILNRLNGTKHLIIGNHDRTGVLLSGWASINNMSEINIDGQHITLCHYAMRVWNRSHKGSWMLYGHSHGSLPDDPNALSIDVGVDCHNYTPIDMREVRNIMKKKTWKAVDHHGK